MSDNTANSALGQTDRRSVNRWQFRADHMQLRQQQMQLELYTSLVVGAIITTLFWNLIPHSMIAAWIVAIIVSIGIRSLTISRDGELKENSQANSWGWQDTGGAMLTGICWGAMGAAAAWYGDLLHQALALVVLAGIATTAYISMQSSPRTLFAFLCSSFLPLTSWFVFEGGLVPYALSATIIVFTSVMLLSSRKMQEILSKAFNLGSHNTELIKKLVTTREAAENSRAYAEQVNVKLQEQIVEREAAEEKIRASEQRMAAIFDSMQDTIYQTDMDGIIKWVTPSIKQLLGYEVEEFIGRDIRDFYVTRDDHTNLKHALNINAGRLQNFETRLVHKNGTHIWISENSHYSYHDGYDATAIEGTIRDITALHAAKEALQQEKERAQVTLGSIGDGVITADLNGDIEYMNSVAEQSTGWKLHDARGRPMNSILKIIDEKTLESPPNPAQMCLKKGGSVTLAGHLLLVHGFRNQRLSVEVNASPIRDANGRITGVVLVFHDVTELRGLAKKMSYQATHDSLTGLINRREFENRIKMAISKAREQGSTHALCYLDLDNFKVVNDTSGHIAGDELLKQLTIKLRMELRDTDIFARLGGDEFGILLEGRDTEAAQGLAETIRRIVENYRFVWDNTFFRIGVSIGLVPITENSGTLTDILSAADSACYVAKEQGRNRIHIYQHDDEAVAERHGQMKWVQRIQNVLEENRFRLFFQPIAKLTIDDNQPLRTHGEVLLRMLDEENNLVGPGSFIPSAERYQLMPAIDRWVITNTFRMLTLDAKRVREKMSTCCINLSGQSLSDERFLDFLIAEIRQTGVPTSLLCFEITETAVIANLSMASTFISSLREMGCRFALDDFGVGLSSFSYLKNLPVDYLKLDGCFVKNMVADRIDRAMVEAINQIGHTMDIRTIAEFVEDVETLEAVRSIGVDYAQGYIISKPVPIEIGLHNDPVDLATHLYQAASNL